MQGGGWRSLARALIAFHLATAHEQNVRENEEKKSLHQHLLEIAQIWAVQRQ